MKIYLYWYNSLINTNHAATTDSIYKYEVKKQTKPSGTVAANSTSSWP